MGWCAVMLVVTALWQQLMCIISYRVAVICKLQTVFVDFFECSG
jgi:hypothetical protein